LERYQGDCWSDNSPTPDRPSACAGASERDALIYLRPHLQKYRIVTLRHGMHYSVTNGPNDRFLYEPIDTKRGEGCASPTFSPDPPSSTMPIAAK
jgi:hypothetical protein